MTRLLLILAISVGYVGCAATAPLAGPQRARSGREIRVWADDAASLATVVRVETSRPIVRRGALSGCRTDRTSCSAAGEGRCARFEPGAAAPDVVAAWEDGLRDPGRALGWLLAPVNGCEAVRAGASEHASGLRSDGAAIELCLDAAAPDLGLRLEHPDLRVPGPAPLERAGPRVLEPWVAGGPSRVEFVGPGGDPAEMIRGGGLDLALLYGKDAARLLDRMPTGLRAERAPGWDKSYALWLAPRGRWLADPAFRRWLADVVDPAALLRLLFDGRGSVGGPFGSPQEAAVAGPVPFGTGSAPRIDVAYDARDPDAARVAARIKALVEQQGVGVRLDADGRGSDDAAVLLAYRSPLDDPLLGLQDALWPVRDTATAALERLQRASRISPSEGRLRAAEELARDLAADGRLLPLLRLDAWRFSDRRLRLDPPAGWGTLGLQSARWSR